MLLVRRSKTNHTTRQRTNDPRRKVWNYTDVSCCVVRDIFALSLDHVGDRNFYRYDSQGIFSAPRALFMFRSFGHEQSSVLDGGLPRWESEGLPTESGPVVEILRSKYPAPTLASEKIRSKSRNAVLCASLLSPHKATIRW